MKTSRSQAIKASPESVWQAISSVESLPDWFSGVESATHTGGPQAGLGRKQRVTRLLYQHDIDVEQEVVAWEPGRLLEMRHVRESLDGREMQAMKDFHTRVSLSPHPDGTQVSIEYSWGASIGRTWLKSFLFGGRVMARELRETLKKIEGLVTQGQESEDG